MLRQLTFEDICPKWTKAIQEQRLFDGLSQAYAHCAVGEAYGFNEDYANYGGKRFCAECRRAAVNLVNGSEYREAAVTVFDCDLIIDYEAFEERSRAFVKHWNEKHAL